MKTKKIIKLNPIPKSASMQGEKRLWDLQFGRFQQAEKAEEDGFTHVQIGFGKPVTIQRFIRETQYKCGGAVGFDKRYCLTQDSEKKHERL